MGKKIAALTATVLLVLFGQVFVAELIGDLFNGMEWGQAALMGGLMYLTAVVIICTWLILQKLQDH